jgi:hypothetical protein
MFLAMAFLAMAFLAMAFLAMVFLAMAFLTDVMVCCNERERNTKLTKDAS